MGNQSHTSSKVSRTVTVILFPPEGEVCYQNCEIVRNAYHPLSFNYLDSEKRPVNVITNLPYQIFAEAL